MALATPRIPNNFFQSMYRLYLSRRRKLSRQFRCGIATDASFAAHLHTGNSRTHNNSPISPLKELVAHQALLPSKAPTKRADTSKKRRTLNTKGSVCSRRRSAMQSPQLDMVLPHTRNLLRIFAPTTRCQDSCVVVMTQPLLLENNVQHMKQLCHHELRQSVRAVQRKNAA